MSSIKSPKLYTNRGNRNITDPCDNLMILTIPFFKPFNVLSRCLNSTLNRCLNISNNIMPKFSSLEKNGHRLRPWYIIGTFQSDNNRSRGLRSIHSKQLGAETIQIVKKTVENSAKIATTVVMRQK